MSAFLRPHGRQDGAGHFGGGEEIDLHLLAQLLRREFLDRTKRPAPGDVGEHIDAPEALKRGVDGFVSRLGVGDVEPDRERRSAIGGRKRIERRRPPRRDDRVVAALQNRLR